MVNFKLGEYTRDVIQVSNTGRSEEKIPITLGFQWHNDVVVVVFFWLYDHAHEHTSTFQT